MIWIRTRRYVALEANSRRKGRSSVRRGVPSEPSTFRRRHRGHGRIVGEREKRELAL